MKIFRAITNLLNDFRGHHLFMTAHRYFEWHRRTYGEQYPELDRYDEQAGMNQKWITMHEIVVETEHDKEQLLAASKYIHDLMELDTDYMAVNYIAHLYETPDLIKVRSAIDTN